MSSVIPVSHLIPLVDMLAEVIDDGWLSGEVRDFVLVVNEELIPAWRDIAPEQTIVPLNQAGSAGRCIIFDATSEATALRERLQQERPPGTVLSFFLGYYPSVCAQTFSPGFMSEEAGPGVIMFQTPRTGSHFMQGMITNLPDFGTPEEWIRPPIVEAVKLGILSLTSHLIRCARHQRAIHRYWATSIVLPFLVDLMPYLNEPERARLQAFIGENHAFLMTRRDRVAQTWSQIRATHSGRFFATSPDDVNKGLDQALLPVEKFWLWIVVNRRNFDAYEGLARTLMQAVGKELPEVSYEELQVQPISAEIHRKALGSLYDPAVHRMNAENIVYIKQSTAVDQAVIADLTGIMDQVEKIDLRQWRNIDRLAVWISNGTGFFGRDRFEISGGWLIFKVLFDRTAGQRTVAVELEVAATPEMPVQLRVERGQDLLFHASLTRNGPYMLLADDDTVLRDDVRFAINVGGGEDNEPPKIVDATRLVAVYGVPVPFSVTPEFPWMSFIKRSDQFALHFLG